MFQFYSSYKNKPTLKYKCKDTYISNYKELLENNIVTYGQYLYDDNLYFDKNTKLFSNLYEIGTYTDLKYYVNDSIESDSYKQQEWDYLYEGLIKSVECNKAIDILNRIFNNYPISFFKVKKQIDIIRTELIEIDLYKDDYNNDENIQFLNNLNIILENLGYRFSHKKETIINNINYISLIYDPEFLEDVTNKVYNNYNGILYHITSIDKYNKILEKGLIPRHIIKDKFNIYSDRVYFYLYKGNDIESYLKLKADDLKRKHNWKDYIILKIDLNAIFVNNRKYSTYRFFEDPYSQEGVFTYENIDPRCIKTLN